MYNRSELLGPRPTECSIKLLFSVCPSVSSAFFSEMAQKFFLICGTMVDNWQIVDRCLKTDRALFSCKIHFCPNLGKKDSIWPQNRVFGIFWKNFSLVFDVSPPILHLAKFWFSSCGPKCCQPIKLQDSLKCNISRKKWVMKFIFGMEISIEVFYKLILSFWVCTTRHA